VRVHDFIIEELGRAHTALAALAGQKIAIERVVVLAENDARLRC
jgi:hypothetical protein